ncbi:MAG TPA: hypothetical protein GXX75_04685 [Clostridiales bacterium]|nr:hypothetical protein [Clostridiales bacterium]
MKWKNHFYNIALILMILAAVLTAMLYDGDTISTSTAFTVMGILYLIAAIVGTVVLIKNRAQRNRHSD